MAAGELLTWSQIAALRALIKGEPSEMVPAQHIRKLRQLCLVEETPSGITVTENGIRTAASLSPR